MKKIYRYLTILIVCLLVIPVTLPQPAYATENISSISLEITDPMVKQYDKFSIYLSAANLKDIYSMDFEIQYPKDMIEYRNRGISDLMLDNGFGISKPIINNGSLAFSIIPFSNNVFSGSGSICRLGFKALKDGIVNLIIKKAILKDKNGTMIDLDQKTDLSFAILHNENPPPSLTINPIWSFTWKSTITVSGKTDFDATITIDITYYDFEKRKPTPRHTIAEIQPDQGGSFKQIIIIPLSKSFLYITATNQRGDKTEEDLTITREVDFFIRLQIGSDKITNQFLTKKMELPPYVDPKTNRTMIPLRSIADAAIQEIKFDSKEQRIIIQNYGMRIDIVLWIGKPIALVNGIEKKIDDQLPLTPAINKGRTFVPLRFLGESMNYKIIWNPATQKIDMYFQGPIGIKEAN
jgi:hypothetical protein